MSQPDRAALDLVDSFGPATTPPLHRTARATKPSHEPADWYRGEEPPVQEDGAPGPAPLPLENLKHLMQRVIDAPRWLVPDLIPMAAVTYLAGPPKGFKTWFALILATAAAEGTEFLGRELDAEGPVLIVDAEVAPAMLQQRVRLVAAGHHVVNDSLARIHVHHGRLFLDREQELARLKAAVAEIQPVLIILDPLAKLHAGLNENDASDMSWLAGAIRELTLIGGAAVVVVHHTIKGGEGRRGGTLLRGSSALWADADALLLIDRDMGDLTVTVDGRYCNGDQKLGARLEIDADSPLPTARLTALDAPTAHAARADAVLEVLRAHPDGLLQTAVRKHLSTANSGAARRALEELERQGLATKIPKTIDGRRNVWKAK